MLEQKRQNVKPDKQRVPLGKRFSTLRDSSPWPGPQKVVLGVALGSVEKVTQGTRPPAGRTAGDTWQLCASAEEAASSEEGAGPQGLPLPPPGLRLRPRVSGGLLAPELPGEGLRRLLQLHPHSPDFSLGPVQLPCPSTGVAPESSLQRHRGLCVVGTGGTDSARKGKYNEANCA